MHRNTRQSGNILGGGGISYVIPSKLLGDMPPPPVSTPMLRRRAHRVSTEAWNVNVYSSGVALVMLRIDTVIYPHLRAQQTKAGR